MDPKETTALIHCDDASPTIEFTLPPRNESYAPESEAAGIPAERHKIPLSRLLRRLTAGILVGIAVMAGCICTGHALMQIAFTPEDIPAVLLTALSAGEVHVIPAADPGISTAAAQPDLPLNSVQAPAEPQPQPEAAPSPLTFTNETPYTPDPGDLLTRARAVPALEELHSIYGTSAPTVLILSTHGTESYAENADNGYRTSDDQGNVIRTASVIAETLENKGIGVIHCRTKFDEEDFTLAYYNASLEIRSQLREHPSIQYIIDVHRDSVQDADGTYLAMESDTGLSRLMFVVGTDHGGSGHTGWEDNLALAARLYTALEDSHPTLMRPVNIRSASFNQQYTKGSLILEIGSCAGSLENALKSAEIFAEALADEIIG